MKNSVAIHIRNLTVYLLVILFATVGAEAVLTPKSDSNDSSLTHKSKTLLLQMESSPLDHILMSSTNVTNVNSMLADTSTSSPRKLTSSGYPLLKNLTSSKLDNAFNIVVIGDSFVWGACSLNRNELFWRVLENNLRDNGINANVYGVGATGANAYEELSWLCNSTLVEDLDPDLVIFGYVYNDAEYVDDIPSVKRNNNEILSFFPDSLVERFPNLSSLLVSKIVAETIYSDKYSDAEYLSVNGSPPILKGRFYEKYKNDFCKKLDSFAENADFPICVMTLPPTPNNKTTEELFKPLRKLYASCKNINYYNSVNEFNRFASKKHKENYSVNPDDFHPGSSTHRFYADYIMDFIQKDFPHLLTQNQGYENKHEININEWLPYDISFQKKSDNVYTFTYPVENAEHIIHGVKYNDGYYLTYPLGEKHIRFNFAEPIRISEITMEGAYKHIKLYYTCVNEKLRYDDNSVYEFTTEKNKFTVSSDVRITSVLVSAQFDEQSDRNITMILNDC